MSETRIEYQLGVNSIQFRNLGERLFVQVRRDWRIDGGSKESRN